MAHKTRAERINLSKSQQKRIDHQTRHKNKSPKVYKREQVDVDKYIEELNDHWGGEDVPTGDS